LGQACKVALAPRAASPAPPERAGNTGRDTQGKARQACTEDGEGEGSHIKGRQQRARRRGTHETLPALPLTALSLCRGIPWHWHNGTAGGESTSFGVRALALPIFAVCACTTTSELRLALTLLGVEGGGAFCVAGSWGMQAWHPPL
jgi:hypothetical protein